MSKINSIKVESNIIAEIKKISPLTKFSTDSPLFYEGQIPIVAYLLIEGHIQLLKHKKLKKILRPGALIGLYELMTHSPADLSAKVQAESTLCFLDKSTIQEILTKQDSDLAELLREEVK